MITIRLSKIIAGPFALIWGGVLLAQITSSDDAFRDFAAGEKFPESTHAYVQLPPAYQPDLRTQVNEYSGTYQGMAAFVGDRRYEPFETSYKIQIRVRSRSDIAVDWHYQVRKAGTREWTKEDPSMAVKHGRFGSGLVWGDMCFKGASEEHVPAPFLAAFVKRPEDGAIGLILFGRYEGPVFLRREP
jgi:hypothetical protein